jgi:preprotein translocase subunit SecA
MLDQIIKAIFGDPDKKKIANYKKVVEAILKKEEEFAHFTLEDVQAKTLELKKLFEGLDFKNPEDSKKIKSILSDIKIDALANHKTACKLLNGQDFELPSGKKITWNMIPYDVQLIG